jgi:hypothetical protein
MFFEYLAQMRRRPKEVRQRFAFVFTIVFVSFVTLLWLSTMFLGRDSVSHVPDVPEKTAPSLFERIKSVVRLTNEQIGSPFDEIVVEEPVLAPAPLVPESALLNTFDALPSTSTPVSMQDAGGAGTSSVPTSEEATSTGSF